MSILLLNAGLSNGFSDGAVISAAIASAFSSLDFNVNYADTISSHYILQPPNIDGTVYDETLHRKTRTELTARATSFDGVNQYLSGGNTSTSKTALSVFAWARPTTLSGTKTLVSEYNSSGSDRGHFLYFSGSKLRAIVSQDGGSTNWKFYESVDDFTVNNFYHVGFTIDTVADEMLMFSNGKSIAVTKTADVNLSGIYDTTEVIQVGTVTGTSGYFEGQIQLPAIWESALTAAEVRDLYLQKYDQVTTPDYGWFLDGVNAYKLTSSSPTLAEANTPTRYEAPEAPDYLNKYGWNFGNQGRVSNSYTSSSVFTFTCKLPSSQSPVYFLTGSVSGDNAAIAQNGSASTAYGDCTSIKIDGVELSDMGGSTRDDFHSAVCDDQVHTVEITSKTQMVTWTYLNYGIANWTSSTITDGYLRLIDVDGESPIIDLSSSVTLLAPKRINLSLDSDGASPTTSNSFGECKRNWQLLDGPCISLDGVNQYGVITNTDDYSGEDWVLSGELQADSIGNDGIFAEDGGNKWLGFGAASSNWRTNASGSVVEFSNGIVIDVAFSFSLEKSGTTFTLTTTNQSTGVTEVDSQTLTMASFSGDLFVGANQLGVGQLEGTIWNLKLDCTTDPTKSFEIPMSDEVATSSKDKSGNGKHITWQNSPSVSTQDSFFDSETNGCSSVPVFVDPVELARVGQLDMDGHKKVEVEVDFVTYSKGYTFYTQGSVSPFRLAFASSGIGFTYRNSTNTTVLATCPFTYEVGTLYKIKCVLVEDEDNPTTASFVRLIDMDSGEIISTVTGLDIALSSATSNSGPPQIGSYANASSSVNADIYRVRTVVDDTIEEVLWYANDHLTNNAADSTSDFAESGGTLAIKKIPALADGSGNDINGYPLNQPVGAYHHDSQALLEEFPVTDSGSQRAVGYGASFDGTLDANINADTAITGYPFSIACDVYFQGTSDTHHLVFVSASTTEYFGLQKLTGGTIRFIRRSSGVITTTTTSFSITAAQWHSLKANFLSETEVTITFDGVDEVMTGLDSRLVVTSATDGDLWIGQFRSSLGESPNFDIKNVVVKQGDTVANNLPLYNDALDRSSNCNHGTLSATGVSFATEARETNLNPTIVEANTRSVTTGDRRIIRIGQQ